jgi:two-component system response regulator FixJ
MLSSDFLVYIVEDDQEFLRTVSTFVRAAGYPVESFSSGEEFLNEVSPDRPACLVSDYRMEGLSGLQIQRRLRERGIDIPIVFVSGAADVGVAVQAMRQGAITLLEKPFSPGDLLKSIEEARSITEKRREVQDQVEEARCLLSGLTEKERDVLWMMIDGHANKVVAYRLGISLRTVERRRHEIFSKTRVNTEVQLAELVNLAGWEKPESVADRDSRAVELPR